LNMPNVPTNCCPDVATSRGLHRSGRLLDCGQTGSYPGQAISNEKSAYSEQSLRSPEGRLSVLIQKQVDYFRLARHPLEEDSQRLPDPTHRAAGPSQN
jgi:hypothetical protein